MFFAVFKTLKQLLSAFTCVLVALLISMLVSKHWYTVINYSKEMFCLAIYSFTVFTQALLGFVSFLPFLFVDVNYF